MRVQRQSRKVQTTVRLPKTLYQEAKSFVSEGGSEVETINDFVIAAIKTYLRVLRRRKIDAAFAGMAEDVGYQREALRLAEEFSPSDWEAFEAEVIGPAARA